MEKIKTKELKEMWDFNSLNIGQLVKKNGKIGVYAGEESKIIIGCLNIRSVHKFPVILYSKKKGKMTKEIVYSLHTKGFAGLWQSKGLKLKSEVLPHDIPLSIEKIRKSDENYTNYQKILNNSAIYNQN